MDRDNRWERTEKAYQAICGQGTNIEKDPQEAVEKSYREGKTDEFIEPVIIVDESQVPVGPVSDSDAVIFLNYRPDRTRQLTKAFVLDDLTRQKTSSDEKISTFQRGKKKDNLYFVTMTEYEKRFPAEVAFPPLDISSPLAKIVSESGLKQLHIAETEKYAHVTYFFNGGTEKPFPGEERILVPSLAGVSHYEEAPEMKASEIAGKVLENFERYDFMVVNLANADLVGHTGSYQACIRAAEALDGALKVMMEKVLASSGVMIITADHGNIELKRNPLTGERLTEHSLNPVPFYLVGKEFRLKAERTEEEIARKKSEIPGILTDLAPTVLELLGLRKPREMTGKSLLDILR